MVSLEFILTTLGLIVVASSATLLLIFYISFLFQWRLQESTVGRVVQASIGISLTAALSAATIMLLQQKAQHPIELVEWVITPSYHLKFEFVLDLLSLSFVILTLVLCSTIGAFSTRYLHHERGYNRFFVLFAIFLMGMVTAALSDTVETMYAGCLSLP